MALVICPECGRKKVSDSAKACPECGFDIKEYYLNLKGQEEDVESICTKETENFEVVLNESVEDMPKPIRQLSLKTILLLSSIIICVVCICTFIMPTIVERVRIIKVENQVKNGTELEKALVYLNSIELNEDEYNIKISCVWKLAQNAYNNKEYLQSIRYLDEISNFDLLGHDKDNAKSMLNDSLFGYALVLYSEGDFPNALSYFNRIEEKSDQILTYIDKANLLNKIQGKWYYVKDFWGGYSVSGSVEVTGWDAEQKSYSLTDKNTVDYETSYNLKECQLNKDHLILIRENDTVYIYITEDNEMKWSVNNSDEWMEYYEKTEELPTPRREPCIGMTAGEVKASTWGVPEDVNKSTYSWGVKEQWCYDGHKYIYLEDGIVTSISE